MAWHASVVTRKGQVTIPADLRRELGIEEGDQVIWFRDNGFLRLETAGNIVQRTAGALKQYARMPPPTAEEEREAFAQAVAQEVVERMNRE